MQKRQILFLTQAAVVAALYAGLAYAGWGVGFGGWQFRCAEALTLLPALTPAAIPGLTIGCLLFNLSSPLGLVDIVFGTLATLLAAICTYWLRNIRLKGLPLLSALMPVLFNGVVVGLILKLTIGLPFWLTMGQIALSELLICFALGLPLIVLLRRIFLHSAFSFLH